MIHNRVAVIGISGAGKSTFARALAAQTGLPLLHGDRLDWLENWGVRPDGELQAMHDVWIAQPRWIIEGWVEAERASRLAAADLVIDLDFPGLLCAWRVLARMLRGERRVEMPDGCVDQFSWRTLKWAVSKAERPSIEAALQVARPKKYVRLTTPREARDWLIREPKYWRG
jgi:adenylate kinase family enzyme